MNCHSGITFLMSRQEKTFTRSRSFLELLLRARKSEEMIHAHAEAVNNTKNAAEKTLNSLKEIVEYVNETRKNLLAYVIAEGFFYFRKFY